MSPNLPSTIPRFKDDSIHVERWWQAMWEAHYQEVVENLTVEKVRWFKEKTLGITHEYLVIAVNVKSHEKIVTLSIERSTSDEVINECLSSNEPLRTFLGDEITDSIPLNERKAYLANLRETFKEEHKNVKAREERFSSRGMVSDSSTNILKKGDPTYAVDAVRRCEVKEDVEPDPDDLDSECLLTMTFDKPNAPKFFLRDLSFMARAVREAQPAYSWSKHNCYWFARTLADLIVAMKDPNVEPPKKVRMPAGSAFLAGQSKSIVKPDPQEVAKLIPKIQCYIDEHNEKIAAEWEEGKGGLIKAKNEIEELHHSHDREIEQRDREIGELHRRITELEASSQKQHVSDLTPSGFDAGKSSTHVY